MSKDRELWELCEDLTEALCENASHFTLSEVCAIAEVYAHSAMHDAAQLIFDAWAENEDEEEPEWRDEDLSKVPDWITIPEPETEDEED